ncbi:transporter (plasmid) [Cupriavidus sp. KK10]|jgi:hypothetical protein|uniref:transporter n=1 Tax=Cupriavidus sp. KK10 TaxID=1478019 RepID=UPI001BA5110B|nr:transporter [Cupriavidus sp. KK10]QUN32612.1 transporter [Cupriavidus sp. KK10]
MNRLSQSAIGVLTTFGIDIPFAKRSQPVSASGAAPVVNWNPAVRVGVQSAVQGQFSSQCQRPLNAQGASESGEGMGDVEMIAGWHYVGDKLRMLGGASLVVPTGKYSASAVPDIGTGNYYRVRPAIQAAYLTTVYLPTSDLAFAVKVCAGLNSRNRVSNLHSGNRFGVGLAAGYKAPIGVVGAHANRVRQYQDDDNDPLGASRFRSDNVGMFSTTQIPVLNAAMTVQNMATTLSRNARHGNFTQAPG